MNETGSYFLWNLAESVISDSAQLWCDFDSLLPYSHGDYQSIDFFALKDRIDSLQEIAEWLYRLLGKARACRKLDTSKDRPAYSFAVGYILKSYLCNYSAVNQKLHYHETLIR